MDSIIQNPMGERKFFFLFHNFGFLENHFFDWRFIWNIRMLKKVKYSVLVKRLKKSKFFLMFFHHSAGTFRAKPLRSKMYLRKNVDFGLCHNELKLRKKSIWQDRALFVSKDKINIYIFWNFFNLRVSEGDPESCNHPNTHLKLEFFFRVLAHYA